jgi:eukaryotic-like serine/threonine-protein kinase
MDAPNKIGRYQILEEKGRGAMGAVYLARDPAMDRIVALKTIHSLALSGPQGR